jgi:hypothetical protein
VFSSVGGIRNDGSGRWIAHASSRRAKLQWQWLVPLGHVGGDGWALGILVLTALRHGQR